MPTFVWFRKDYLFFEGQDHESSALVNEPSFLGLLENVIVSCFKQLEDGTCAILKML